MDVSASARLVEEREHASSLWQLFDDSLHEGEANRPLHMYYERLMELNSSEPVSLAGENFFSIFCPFTYTILSQKVICKRVT